MKKPVIIIGIVIFLFGVSFFLIRNTTYYTIFQICRSIQNHDVSTFRVYVDLDSVLNNFGDDSQKFFYKSMADEAKKSKYDNNYSALRASLEMQATSMIMPQIIKNSKEAFKREMIRQIEEKRATDEVTEHKISLSKEGSVIDAVIDKNRLNLKRVFSIRNKYDIKKEGKIAQLKLLGADKSVDIVIHFINMPSHYWKVVRLEIPMLFKGAETKQLPDILEKMMPQGIKTSEPLDKIKNGNGYTNYLLLLCEKIAQRVEENQKDYSKGGVVSVIFRLKSDGTVLAISIDPRLSTIDNMLREIAIKSVKEAAPFPAFPKNLKKPEWLFNITISFKQIKSENQEKNKDNVHPAENKIDADPIFTKD